MTKLTDTNRRTVLKTIGAGVAGTSILSGIGSANGGKGAYGNGNGIGSFLNEKPLFKKRPVWDSGVVDLTGQDTAEVDLGTMVSVDIPETDQLPPHLDEPPEEGPFGFDPRVIEVSPGTTVRWVWTGNAFAVLPGRAWPHDVASLDQLFHSETKGTGTYEYDFEEPGVYLYFCHPHGNPVPDNEHPNLFGMRGAVIVSD